MKQTKILWTVAVAIVATMLTSLPAEAQTRVIAHRGFWQTEGSAQNSLASLRKAAEVGCYGAEFDVWYTADNRLVVFHDNKCDNKHLEQTPADQLTAHTLQNGEPLPTLDQYLSEALNHPALHLVLEFKTDKISAERQREAVRAIVEKVRGYGLAERTDYISFSLDACDAFVEAAPEAKVFYLRGELGPRKLEEHRLAGASYHHSILLGINSRWVEKCHKRGMEMNVWTVNEPEMMQKAVNLGLDYITTDNPVEALRLTKGV